jgi:hypothetical protein
MLTGPNEDGWRCNNCDEVLGFRPDLDRSHAGLKVSGILFEFHMANLIYISNGTMGEVITENVVHRCREANTYDQQSILRLILEDPNLSETHAAFWQNRAERWLLGGEPIRDEQESLFS